MPQLGVESVIACLVSKAVLTNKCAPEVLPHCSSSECPPGHVSMLCRLYFRVSQLGRRGGCLDCPHIDTLISSFSFFTLQSMHPLTFLVCIFCGTIVHWDVDVLASLLSRQQHINHNKVALMSNVKSIVSTHIVLIFIIINWINKAFLAMYVNFLLASTNGARVEKVYFLNTQEKTDM